MCERYTITTSADELATRFSVEVPPFYKPRFNAAPTQLLPVITSEHPEGLSHFYWGMPPHQSKNKGVSERFINLRAESIAEKQAFKKAIQERRCIIPADGFYGWKRIGKKTVTPYRITLSTKSIFSMAGVWEEYEDIAGQAYHTFMLVTMPASSIVSSISERMPLMLTPEGEKIWLSKNFSEAEIIRSMVACSALTLEAYTIAPGINNVAADNKTLIIPAPAADQFGNLTLFN